MSMRWAVYFAPPSGSPLEELASRWLGRDLDGRPVARPPVDGFDETRLTEVTRSPRHYGFHATLKPPFALTQGTDPAGLRDAAAAFAAGRAAFEAPKPVVKAIGSFLALGLSADCPTMDALAADCVRAFEPFRAPQTAAEVEKRREAGLTPRQNGLLDRWGYPYVMEEFRFHMTLTGPVADDAERAALRTVLSAWMAPIVDAPLMVDAIALYAQDDRDAAFTLRERFPFGR